MTAPTNGRTGPDRLTLILGGGVAIVIAGIIGLTVIGSDGEPAATTTTATTATTATPFDESTDDGTAQASVPEPYKRLGVAPVTGCSYGCLEPMTYAVATTDGRREVSVVEGGEVSIRLTITNPTSFEATLMSASVTDPSTFALQVAGEGSNACPGVGDAPLKIAASGDTTCELTYTYGLDYSQTLMLAVKYSYLFVDEHGTLNEEGGQINSNALSSLSVDVG